MTTVLNISGKRAELDELIFRIETGQDRVPWKHYQTLKLKAEELLKNEVRIVALRNGSTYETELKRYRRIRHHERMEAMVNRHQVLHPEDVSMKPLILAVQSARPDEVISGNDPSVPAKV